MADYIKREDLNANVDEALRLLDADNAGGDLDYGIYCELHDAICMIADPSLPASDVMPVVRCKDCMYRVTDLATNARWCIWNSRISDDDYFCADGKRKEAKK